MKDKGSIDISIQYCPGCKWLTRAAWYAQELLSTFETELDAVSLIPSKTSGEFVIALGNQVVMDRAEEGFLEAKIVKRRVRDILDPSRALGHIDA